MTNNQAQRFVDLTHVPVPRTAREGDTAVTYPLIRNTPGLGPVIVGEAIATFSSEDLGLYGAALSTWMQRHGM